MKQFSTIITVEFPENGKSFELDAMEVIPEIKDDKSDAGILYKMSQRFVVDLPERETLLYFRTMRRCIVTLRDLQGKTYRIGTRNIPALCMIVPNINRAELVVEADMIANPLL